ncbi:hypothetical protein ACOMHN_015126 [Nucella lapillus]
MGDPDQACKAVTSVAAVPRARGRGGEAIRCCVQRRPGPPSFPQQTTGDVSPREDLVSAWRHGSLPKIGAVRGATGRFPRLVQCVAPRVASHDWCSAWRHGSLPTIGVVRGATGRFPRLVQCVAPRALPTIGVVRGATGRFPRLV